MKKYLEESGEIHLEVIDKPINGFTQFKANIILSAELFHSYSEKELNYKSDVA